MPCSAGELVLSRGQREDLDANPVVHCSHGSNCMSTASFLPTCTTGQQLRTFVFNKCRLFLYNHRNLKLFSCTVNIGAPGMDKLKKVLHFDRIKNTLFVLKSFGKNSQGFCS